MFAALLDILIAALIFPFYSRDKTIRDPFDPAHRIEREVGERGRRLFAGIELQRDLRSVIGAMTVIEGKGKYLRVIGSTSCVHELDLHTQKILTQLASSPDPTLLDWRAIQEDVAFTIATVAESLKSQAGKYVDRLMVIATLDPGLHIQDTDGKTRHFPLCDPNLLAEMTGITIVDAFGIRDRAAHGTGQGLFSMPAWLLLADRAKPIANCNRALIQIGTECRAYFLPASDGLDIEIPEIRFLNIDTRPILVQYFDIESNQFESELHQCNIQGQCIPELVAHIRRTLNSKHCDCESTMSESKSDFARSFVVALTDELLHQLNSSVNKQTIDEWFIDSSHSILGSFVNQFQRACPKSKVQPASSILEQAGASSAVLTSILGAMNVDQVPGNIPWITGADSQRILGRITPGSPSNWRQLLREMADFQPPAMRLRDAV